MRDIKVISIILFAFTILMGGCSEDLSEGFYVNESYLRIEDGILYFSDSTISVSTVIDSKGEEWSITKKPEWLEVAPMKGNGKCSVSVKVIEYSQSETTVNDFIHCQLGNLTGKIQVCRAPYKFVVSPTTESSFGAQDDSKKELFIRCNTTWNIKKDSSWCHVSEQSAKGDKTILVYCDKNTTNQIRRDTLQIMTNLDTIYVSVFQTSSVYYINPTTPKLEFEVEGGEQSFTVDSNTEWTTRLVYGNIGTLKRSANQLTFVANRNTTAEEKYDTILIESIGSDVKALVPVHQKGLDPILEIKPESLATMPLRFANQGGEGTIGIESNLKWTANSSDESWCHIESPASEVTGNGEVKIRVDVNPAEAPERDCNVLIKSSSGNKTIKVHQAKGDAGYLKATPSSLDAQPQGGTLTFNIESNLSSWTVSSNQSWCKVQTASGSFNGTVSLSVELNSGTDARDATITIKSVIGDVTVTVHQEPKDVPGDDDNPNPKYSRKR